MTKEAVHAAGGIDVGHIEKENDERLARWQMDYRKIIFYTDAAGEEHPIKLKLPFPYRFVCVPVVLKGQLWGILNLYFKQQYKWSFQADHLFENLKFLQNISNQIAIFIENRSLQKHATFYKEVHHRVKNNLQNIASLLRMQLRRLDRISAEQAISDSIARIMSIALVHDTLSQGEIGMVNLQKLISGIMKFCESEASHKIDITLDVSQTFAMIPSRQATTLALVINELGLNAVQHGLKNIENGRLFVQGKMIDGDICVTISDNGPGLSDSFDIERDGNLGMTIVQTLVKDELNGHFQIDGSNGTCASIRFSPRKVVMS